MKKEGHTGIFDSLRFGETLAVHTQEGGLLDFKDVLHDHFDDSVDIKWEV